MRNVYVQFVGNSASGKTTIYNELKKLLEKEEIPYIQRSPFLKKNTLFCRIIWGIYLFRFIDFNAISLFGRPTAIKRRSQKFCLTEYLKTKYHLSLFKKSHKKVLLYDGGGFISLAIHGIVRNVLSGDRALIFAYSVMSKNNLIVYVKTSYDENIRRLVKREEMKRNMKKIEKESLNKMHKTQKIYGNAINYLVKNISSFFDTIYLDSNNSPKENAKVVLDEIKKTNIHNS